MVPQAAGQGVKLPRHWGHSPFFLFRIVWYYEGGSGNGLLQTAQAPWTAAAAVGEIGVAVPGAEDLQSFPAGAGIFLALFCSLKLVLVLASVFLVVLGILAWEP